MASKLALAEAFSDTAMDVLYDDELMSKGSLLLHDLSFSTEPLVGVPATGGFIPNLAWETAAAIIGSGTHDSLRSTLSYNLTGADGQMERTSKGGLHVEIKQSGYTNGRGAAIRAAAALEAYIEAHPNNDFYFSIYSRITRAALAGSPSESFSSFIYNSTAGALANYLLGFYRSGYDSSAGIPAGNARADPAKNTVGNTYRSVGPTNWTGTAPSAGQLRALLADWGNYTNAGLSAGNAHPSWIFYRCYLEDLTVSGRTYAQVDALDHAIWAKAFADGGRYYGDTFTAPT